MRTVLKQSSLVALLIITALPAAAHHSRIIYDRERTVTIEGTVTAFEWANPHVYLYVETQTDAGDSVVWEIEHGSTTAMGRRGWSPDSFAPGDQVSVRANPGKDPRRSIAWAATVEKGGVTWVGRGSLLPEVREEPSFEADSLSGIWVVPQEELVGYFSEPFSWPVTDIGAVARASYDDSTMNPQIQCEARTAPWFMIFPSVQSIEVSENTVSIRSEYDTVERTVRMDVSSHDGAVSTHQGHSIGWWEGDVLVVDTTHFSDHRNGNARGIPSGSQKHLIERFQLSADRTGLIYRFVLEDPEYLTAAVTGEVRSAYRPDLEFSPIPCDLENARRFTGG